MNEYPVAVSLKRGTTGRCTRKVCECEKEGLGLECIHLEPVVDGYPLWSGIPKAEPVQEELKPKLGKRAIKAFEAALAQVEKETAHAAEDWQDTTQMGYVVKPYTAPPQRKPLTDEELRDLWSWAMTAEAERTATTQQHAFARAIERAHGIGEKDE